MVTKTVSAELPAALLPETVPLAVVPVPAAEAGAVLEAAIRASM